MDLYRDFAYAKLTVDVPSATVNAVSTVTVDSTSRLPSNSELGAGEFWMTLESDLTTGAFEIVRVLSRTSTTVNILRGQDGTSPVAHSAGFYLKASISAAMLRRIGQYQRYNDLGNALISGRCTVGSSTTVSRGLMAQAIAGRGVAGVASLGLTYRLMTSGVHSVTTVSAVLAPSRGFVPNVIHGAATVSAQLRVPGLSSSSAGVGAVSGTLTTSAPTDQYTASYGDHY